MANDLEKIGIHMPGLTSKFGLFFGRNNTWYGDGITNVHTGALSIGDLGRVAAFNYSKTNPAFSGKCAKYGGSADLFPPYMEEETKQFVFNTDLCRTLELESTGITEKVHKTPGVVFELKAKFYANSSVNPDNSCYEGEGQMLPSGIFNASACRFGAPVFLSQLHFLEADSYYASLLTPQSLKPNKSRHETKFVFETTSGVPLKLSARFQVNVNLVKVKELSAFKTLPETTFLPYMWSEISMELDEEMSLGLLILNSFTVIIITVGSVITAIGLGLVIYGYFHYMTSLRTDQNYSKVQAGSSAENPEEENPEEEEVQTEVSETRNEQNDQ